MHGSLRSPRAAFRRKTGEALRNAELMRSLTLIERDLDGILHFDRDDAKARRHLSDAKRIWQRDRDMLDDATRDKLKAVVRTIWIHADWQDWHWAERPGAEPFDLFTKRELVDIAIAREATGKPLLFTDDIKNWITRNYDLETVKQLIAAGTTGWTGFALMHLVHAVDNYFTHRVSLHERHAVPDNWPGQVRACVKQLFDESRLAPEARGSCWYILQTLRERETDMVAQAVRQARAPFRPS